MIEGFCGKFGTVFTNILKQIAKCNLCEVCKSESKCKVPFLKFRKDCVWASPLPPPKKKKGLLSITDAIGGGFDLIGDTFINGIKTAYDGLNRTNKTILEPMDDVDWISNTSSPANYMDVTGNIDGEQCEEFCIKMGFPDGAYGAETFVGDIGDNVVAINLYAESQMRSDATGNQPCCPVNNQYGKPSTCVSCTCDCGETPCYMLNEFPMGEPVESPMTYEEEMRSALSYSVVVEEFFLTDNPTTNPSPNPTPAPEKKEENAPTTAPVDLRPLSFGSTSPTVYFSAAEPRSKHAMLMWTPLSVGVLLASLYY
jgi:hypothetical protein